jgi:hypothetical protein
VVGKHDAWGERYRTYTLSTALPTLVSEGIPATSPIYKSVQALASSSPKPTTVAVGRLVDDYDQTTTLTVGSTVTVGDIYAFTLRAPDGTTTAISYTAQTGDTPTLVATAVAALIDAVTGISSTSAVAVITNVADNSNEFWQFEDLDLVQFQFEDTTVDSSLATEVGEIDALYPSWYGLILADPQSKARVTALAAYVETKEKIFGVTSFDGENGVTSTTTSVCYALNAAGYNRTYVLYSNDQTTRGAAHWMGTMFALDAGSATWANKGLSGLTFDTLTTTFEANIKLSKGNTYTKINGVSITREGTMASGEWIDAIRGRDWFVAEVRANVYGLLVNAPKVPFTDGGILLVTKEVEAAQTAGVQRGFLAADPAPFVTAPLAADVTDANKIARILPDVYFEQTLAGAIHSVVLYGVLKV